MEQIKIGKFIAELRKEKNLSQAELGERIGVTNKTVSRWENGNYMPDISMMLVLCRQFDVNINELLSGSRLTGEEYCLQAETNIIDCLNEQKQLKRRRTIEGFLEGGGVGILISIVFSTDAMISPRKTVFGCIAVLMILAGWYYRKKCPTNSV